MAIKVKKESQQKAREARAAILKAAESIFSRQGLAGARTEAIAQEAGVNKAMLYYYFDSKERLYEAVATEQFRKFNEDALVILTALGSPRDLLLRYVDMHIDFIAEHQHHASFFQQMMLTRGKSLSTLVTKHFKPRVQAFDALLGRGMKEGVFRNADRMHTAVSITSLIVFYFSAAPVLRLLGNIDAFTPANLAQRKREVFDFIRFALFVHPEET